MSLRMRIRFMDREWKNKNTKKQACKMARYDEDLHENPFFNTLVSKYNIIFSEAAEKKCMVSKICKPITGHSVVTSRIKEKGRGQLYV